MKILGINIEGKNYNFLKSIEYNNKYYMAYSDKDSIIISEYTYDNNSFYIDEIDENTFNIVKGLMNL